MSEYSRWRERRSTALTAKPTAKPSAAHAKCRQGHANDYARAHQVRRTRRATHRPLAHVRQVHRPCRAEPPRRRHAASRQEWSLGGTHADSTPAHAKQLCPAANAEPAIDPWHAHAKCAACAGPSRQDRRHAADSMPAHAKRRAAEAIFEAATSTSTVERRCRELRELSENSLLQAHRQSCFHLLRSSSTTRRPRTSTSARSPKPPSTTALQRPTQPARRFRSAPCARTCVYSCV
jgi:hypothetical protein